MREFVFFLAMLCFIIPRFAYGEFNTENLSDIELALREVKETCYNIPDALSGLKEKAGIGIGVSAVGTVSGTGALVAGVAKKEVDKEFDEELTKLLKETFNETGGLEDFQPNLTNIEMNIENYTYEQYLQDVKAQVNNPQLQELDRKSVTLGNIRTVGLGINTATNIAGAIVNSKNKIDDDLKQQIEQCKQAVEKLSDVKERSRINGMLDIETAQSINKIVSVCEMYETIDLDKINKMVKSAMISNSVGAVTGGAGTVVSGVANSESVRYNPGAKKDALNTTSNVLAGGATVASVGAVIFDAIQLKSLKKLIQIAEDCKGVL